VECSTIAQARWTTHDSGERIQDREVGAADEKPARLLDDAVR
jgi:hypothetical protein